MNISLLITIAKALLLLAIFAHIEENTRFPALTFAYWAYFAAGLLLGFFKITY